MPDGGDSSPESPGELVLDYSSGSFAEFIDSTDAPASPSGTVPAPSPASDPVAVGAAVPVAAIRQAGPPEGLGSPARRGRGVGPLVLALSVVLAAGVTVGAVALVRHHPAKLSTAGSVGQASASPVGTAASGQPASPAAPGGQWSAPSPVAALQGGQDTVTGATCPAGSADCFAVTTGGTVLLSQGAGKWQAAASDPRGGLVAISCAVVTSCLAVDTSGYALILGPNGWNSPVYVDARSGTLTSVSCPSPKFCLAVDSGGSAFAYRGGGWTPFTVDSSGTALNGVSCPRAGYCVAVSSAGSAYTYNGNSWHAQTVDKGHALTAVACASQQFCAATDSSGDAAVLTGGRWKVSPMGTTARAIECPADGSCVAVDGNGGSVSYSGGAWSSPARIDGHVPLDAVACSEPGRCLAADHQGNVLYYRQAG